MNTAFRFLPGPLGGVPTAPRVPQTQMLRRRGVIALRHGDVFEFVGWTMGLLEALDLLHGNMTMARFFRECRAPALEVANVGVKAPAPGIVHPNDRVDMNVALIRMKRERIFMARELTRQCRPRCIDEGLTRRSSLGAQNDVG